LRKKASLPLSLSRARAYIMRERDFFYFFYIMRRLWEKKSEINKIDFFDKKLKGKVWVMNFN